MGLNLVIVVLQGIADELKEVFTAVGSDPVVEIFLGVQLSYLGIEWEFGVFG